MRQFFLTCLFFVSTNFIHAQSVGINSSNPHPSAILDVSSTNKGFLMPRMTTVQRDAIVNPVQGLMIFNIDDRCIDTHADTSWLKNCSFKDNGAYSLPSGNWSPVADFPGPFRNEAVGFSIGVKGYFGTGNSYPIFYNDFWEYDPIANLWAQKANIGSMSRSGATGFSIGTKGYVGTGYTYIDNQTPFYFNDFWEYDPNLNTWLQRSDFGGGIRVKAVGFSIDGKGYLGTGVGFNSTKKKDFWEYNPTTNAWLQKADFGGTPRYGAVGFSISNKGYIGTGNDGSSKNDFWEYNPNTNLWAQKANFSGVPRSEAVGFSYVYDDGINGNYFGYIGGGNGRDFWRYNAETNNWTQLEDFPGPENSLNSLVAFSMNDKAYVGLQKYWAINFTSVPGIVYKQTMPENATKYVGHDWTTEGNKLYPSFDNAKIFLQGTNTLEFGGNYPGKEINAGKIGYSTFSNNALDIVGAGNSYPNRNIKIHDRLYFENILANRKIVLWGADNDHQFFGLGIEPGTMRYQVAGAGNVHRFFAGTSPTNSTLLMTIYDNGNTEISGQGFKPGGGVWAASSDLRVKKNVLDYNFGLNEILKIRPVSYQYNGEGNTKENGKTYVGVIAQEIENILPGSVTVSKEGDIEDMRTFDGSEIQFALINAIKELKKENDVLNEKLKIKSEEFKVMREELTIMHVACEKALKLIESKLR